MKLPPVLFLLCLCPCHGADRELELSPIVGYQPKVDVRDAALIDRDLDLITSLLHDAKHIEAKDVYQQGAFSRSVAKLNFGFEGLPGEVAPHSPVTVASEDGNTMIKGELFEHGTLGDGSVHILYDNLDNDRKCFVGGHPEPVVNGCFPVAGHIRFDDLGKAVRYSYNLLHGNTNDRTLAKFSTDAYQKMKPCPRCELFHEYKRFYQYYGKMDYAHRWIMSAFEATRIVFDSSVSDFTIYSLESRAKAAQKAIVTMNVYMYVVRMLEEGVHQCRKATEENQSPDQALKQVDTAVAFYTGSLEDGSGEGKLLYALADLECKQFKTCGTKGDSTKGTAKVNVDILDEMSLIQANVATLSCTEARHHKEQIMWRMRVPLIQGTLRYAHLRSSDKATGTDKALGAAYAASVVPLIASCNFGDGEIIGDAMETMTKQMDFAVVKDAFERHYACLAVTCKDVGGYWDADKKQYHEGAEPCIDAEAASESGDGNKKTGWAIAVPLFVVAALLFVVVRRRRARRRKRTHDDDYSDSSSDDSDYDFRFS